MVAPANYNHPMPKQPWIDPQQATLPARPWRKIHLDFHNSQHVPEIGAHFDAGEFGDCLAAAHVDSIVVFAKDMHGYFYYPSQYGPVHPGLSFDLLGQQVQACRDRGIKVYAYYCTTWDNYLAEQHPEWLVFKRDRTTYLPPFDGTPGWTALCLSHDGFVQLMLDHAREFVSRYELDGAWFDMPVPIAGECFCAECLRQLRSQGLDPFDTRVQREHKHALHKSFIQRMQSTVQAARPGCQVDFNGQGVYGLRERVPYMDNVDIEALPTAFWGYYYFPTIVRYARTCGITTYGMSGRFQSAWADFGGLKLPAQLHTELASIVANGARCDIGDQAPPNGRLDPAVYHVIGEAYGRIKQLEPYLEGAVPVTEAALLVKGLPLDWPSTDVHYGLVKLMLESHLQFDVVEPDVDWERYRLIVLPETLQVDELLARRLDAYVADGGALIVSDTAGLLAGTSTSWVERHGLQYEGPSPFKPAYMVADVVATGQHLPGFEYALYEGASHWRTSSPATSLAALGEPAFQRNAAHYTSHAQTPFDHVTDYSAVARSGSMALFGFPLGVSYYNHGYWIYRHMFQQVLDTLLPQRLVHSNVPISSEVTLTHQAADATSARKERYLVHVVNFSALRHTPKHPDFYEDPIALTGVTVNVNLQARVTSAYAAVAGQAVPISHTPDGAVQFTLPRVPINEIVVLNVE